MKLIQKQVERLDDTLGAEVFAASEAEVAAWMTALAELQHNASAELPKI